jgi:signal transduction histidine kinase
MGGAGTRRGRREWVADGLIWAVVTAPVAGNYLSSGEYPRCAVAVAALTVAVLSARRAPILGWVVVVLGTVFDGNFALAIPVLSYLVGLRTERVRPVVVAFLVITAGGTVLNLGILRTGPAQWFTLVMILLLIGVFPWLVGRYRAQRARLVSAGWERAARLEYERRMVARQAQLLERARIAQEMHDSLGHELSLIALGAGALETTAGLPGPQRAAAGRIRESAATATDQLREIIGVLRDEDEAAPLEPAGEPVEALVARAREAGIPVTMRRTGATPPPAVERTAYRVVREALTNVSRHAPGSTATVELTHRDDTTSVSIVDAPAAGGPRTAATAGGRPGRDPGAVPPTTGGAAGRGPDVAVSAGGVLGRGPVEQNTGLGLLGLRERVRLAGGTLTAGPTPAGGFRLVAELPHRAGPVPGAEVPVVTELRSAQRQARRSLAALLTPAALAAVTAVGYYSLAVFHSELDGDTYDRIAVGTPRAELAGLLPDRQAWQQPTADLPPAPPHARCEFYTDGDFPMADAAYRLCFAGGRLVGKDRLP